MFEAHEVEARKFVGQVAAEMNQPEDHQTVMRVMTSVFHAIRDVITVEESLHLIAQLPLYIKGLYVTEWHLGEKKKMKDKDDFIESLLLKNDKTGALDFGTDEKALTRTKAVIKVLKRKVSPGLIEKLIAQFPADLKDLWYEDAVAGSPAKSIL
ncbi:MAG TPA: DUF2267 domain-containing protein [Ohtaekwangia sp.]|uniref:DUF2267 domain-containing protein n=1 Tax=Ohtaekwangia sp. TaxID=2066019 RepID=UPI002F94DC2B